MKAFLLLISASLTFLVAASVLLSLFKRLQHVSMRIFESKLLFSSFQELPRLIRSQIVSATRQIYSKISQLFFQQFFFRKSKNPPKFFSKIHFVSKVSVQKFRRIQFNFFKIFGKFFQVLKIHYSNVHYLEINLPLLLPASSLGTRRVVFSLVLIHSRKPVSFSNN